jgi:hypothetical protein
MAFVSKHDILGLHIPVDDAMVVSKLERGAHLSDDLNYTRQRQTISGLCPLPEEITQIAARNELHNYETDLAISVIVEYLDNVGVMQRGDGARFPPEPVTTARLAQQVWIENLERHKTIEGWLIGSVNLGHTATADPLMHFIAPKMPPDEFVLHLEKYLSSSLGVISVAGGMGISGPTDVCKRQTV